MITKVRCQLFNLMYYISSSSCLGIYSSVLIIAKYLVFYNDEDI